MPMVIVSKHFMVKVRVIYYAVSREMVSFAKPIIHRYQWDLLLSSLWPVYLDFCLWFAYFDPQGNAVGNCCWEKVLLTYLIQ